MKPIPSKEACSKEAAAITKEARELLGIKLERASRVVGMLPANLYNKETGRAKMRKTEYEALMNFYKQEALFDAV